LKRIDQYCLKKRYREIIPSVKKEVAIKKKNKEKRKKKTKADERKGAFDKARAWALTRAREQKKKNNNEWNYIERKGKQQKCAEKKWRKRIWQEIHWNKSTTSKIT